MININKVEKQIKAIKPVNNYTSKLKANIVALIAKIKEEGQ